MKADKSTDASSMDQEANTSERPVLLSHYQPDSGTATRYLFFTGKGGVGKTSLSCATALRLAEAGKRLLLVSTDPASNLDEVLETKLTNHPTPIAGASGLEALNINPVEAAAAYRERLIGPMRGILPESALRSMEEQLSGSCTMEIAAFDEFAGLIGDLDSVAMYDHIVFDTAPTGHTLRLMSLAKAWDQFLDHNQSGTSCLGPLAGLEKQRAMYETAVATLVNPLLTTLVLVSRPQRASLREAQRTSLELRQLGVSRQELVINGVFHTDCPDDRVAQAMQDRGRKALADAGDFLASMPRFFVPLRAVNILGLAGLRHLFDGDASVATIEMDSWWQAPVMLCLNTVVDELERKGKGVIMTMGKGGVGKTTVAAALAVALAKRGHAVHLTTTDPAAHLAQTLDGSLPGLSLSRIDPVAETAAYTATVIAEQAARLDDAALSLLKEDLRSPCTEEIAVFRAFAREVARGEKGFVVLDTAPTGHTLLLLDASEAYQRESERQAGTFQSEEVLHLLQRLRDPNFTSMILVTLPEATPVHEAADLQEDLRRAQIEPFAWVMNQSLYGCDTCDPLLKMREESERRYLKEVAEIHAQRVAWLPWQTQEPVGVAALIALSASIPL